MSFFRRSRQESESEGVMDKRSEQKRRSMKADKKYYRAMRHLAIEAHDPEGMSFYERRLKEIQSLEDELDVMTDSPSAESRADEH